MINRRLRYGLLGVALLVLAGLLAGCASSSRATTFTGSSWPGIAHADEAIYVAYGPQVYAVNPETGAQLWHYPSEPARGRTFFASPAVTDDLVIVTDYADTLAALDAATGAERWTFESNRSRFIGGAVVDDGHVYAGTVDGTMYALDRTSGEEIWSFSGDRDIWSKPLLDGDTLYFTSLDRHLYALDAATGVLKWQFPREGETSDPPVGAMVGTPTLYDGLLVFGSFSNYVYALDTETQQLKWSYPTSNWVWSSPVYVEAANLLVGGDLDGHVFALEPENGAVAWTFDAGGPVVGEPAIGEIDGTPVVYVASEDSKVYVLDASDGTPAAQPISVESEFTSRFLFFSTGSSVRPVPLYASPVVFGDLLVVGMHQGQDLLYALDSQTLLERWHFSTASS